MNFSFSTNLKTSLPQIGQYGTRLGTLVSNFSDPSKLDFHNLIGGSFVGLQTLSVGETLYCMIGQPNESTKKIKQMHISVPYQSFKTILQTTYNPGFKIWNLLDQLQNEGSFL
jgi:hypothetical protein